MPTPKWLAPIFSFCLGVAITAAAMTPVGFSNDYIRGQTAGYRQGLDDAAHHEQQLANTLGAQIKTLHDRVRELESLTASR